MIEEPVITGIVRHNLGVMAGAHKGIAFLNQHFVLVVHHATAFLVDVGAEKIVRTPYNGSVGTVQPLTATSYGSKEIVMSVFLMDISTLVSGSRHLLRCGAFLQRQAVIGQFNRIDSTEAAPEKIFLSSLLYVERVDGTSSRGP